MQKISLSDYSAIKDVLPALPAQESAATPAGTRMPPCPLGWCDGTGYYLFDVPFGHALFGELQACGCRLQAHQQLREREQRDRRILLLGQLDSELGGKLARCTLENYRLEWATDGDALKTMANALAHCRLYAGNPCGWLYIHGPTGIGKSHLAAATARVIAEQHGIPTSYTTEPGLISFLREGWGKQGEESAEGRMRALQSCDLLVLDDIGTAFRGKGEQAWVDAQLFELLQPRYLHSRPTILTSNLPPEDLEPRLKSRIKGEAIEIAIDNADQRGKHHG